MEATIVVGLDILYPALEGKEDTAIIKHGDRSFFDFCTMIAHHVPAIILYGDNLHRSRHRKPFLEVAQSNGYTVKVVVMDGQHRCNLAPGCYGYKPGSDRVNWFKPLGAGCTESPQ
jgi:hypothetical protein